MEDGFTPQQEYHAKIIIFSHLMDKPKRTNFMWTIKHKIYKEYHQQSCSHNTDEEHSAER